MKSGDERHTTRHTRPRRENLGKWQRHLLIEAVEPTRHADGKVRWSALVRRQAPNTTTESEHRKTATKLAAALTALEEAGLVRVTPPRGSTARRVVSYYELTGRGLRRAEEIVEHGGLTKATVARKSRETRHSATWVRPVADGWHRSRGQAQSMLRDPDLLDALEAEFGKRPVMGGGTPVEEAAKRFYVLGRSLIMQQEAPEVAEAVEAFARTVEREGLSAFGSPTPERFDPSRGERPGVTYYPKRRPSLHNDALHDDLE